MLICNNCGRTIKEEDLIKNRDFVGYRGEEPIYEMNADSCFCGGEWEEAVECDSCGQYYTKSEISFGWKSNLNYCKDCISYYRLKYNGLSEDFSDDGDFIDCLFDKNLIKK